LKGNFDEKQDRDKNTRRIKRNEIATSPQDRVAIEREFQSSSSSTASKKSNLKEKIQVIQSELNRTSGKC